MFMSNSKHLDLALFDLSVQPCPLCSGTSFETLARHDRNLLGVISVGCRQCGLVQTNPRPSAQGLDLFYRDHYRLYYQRTEAPDVAYIASLDKDRRLAATAEYFLTELKLPRDAVVLDFGCGEGTLFAALRKAGLGGAFYGVELNAKFGEYASAQGNALVSSTIACREPVDLIIVNHVLEHLHDPVGTLRRLAALLKPGGRLYVDVPDAEEYRTIFDLHIAHIYHFTERTLRRLVEQAGLDVERVEKHRPIAHPRSVRLVARAATVAQQALEPSSAQTEAAAWEAVRRSGRLVNTARLRLARYGALRRVYHLARRLARPRAA